MRAPERSVELTQVTEWEDGLVRSLRDSLAAEEPLELRVDGQPLTVTMRTPGHDLELAAGFLLTEGIIESLGQIAGLRSKAPENGLRSNVVEVELQDTDFDSAHLQRNFFAASSCGICGKASINAIRVRGLMQPDTGFRLDAEVLCRFPETLRSEQAVFSRTGGLHAAALFDSSGQLMALREDIGRRNAVDKIVGWALLQEKLPLSRNVMLVSGRGGFEIVQKALAAGVSQHPDRAPAVVLVEAGRGRAVHHLKLADPLQAVGVGARDLPVDPLLDHLRIARWRKIVDQVLRGDAIGRLRNQLPETVIEHAEQSASRYLTARILLRNRVQLVMKLDNLSANRPRVDISRHKLQPIFAGVERAGPTCHAKYREGLVNSANRFNRSSCSQVDHNMVAVLFMRLQAHNPT